RVNYDLFHLLLYIVAGPALWLVFKYSAPLLPVPFWVISSLLMLVFAGLVLLLDGASLKRVLLRTS
ncbi:MAG: hypothetical protein U0T75_10125, partial [Chitinophagales bacterium]